MTNDREGYFKIFVFFCNFICNKYIIRYLQYGVKLDIVIFEIMHTFAV